MTFPDQETLGPVPEIYVLFSNKDLPFTSWGQPTTTAQAGNVWAVSRTSPTINSKELLVPGVEIWFRWSLALEVGYCQPT